MTTPQASAPQPPADRASPPRRPVPAEPSPQPDSERTAAVRVACGAEIALRLVTATGDEIPFSARLTYTEADPYAVRLHCRTAPATAVTWVLSRETLHQGLARPSGLGDVRVRPAPGTGPSGANSVLITLGSGRDAALLRGDAGEVQRFLDLSAAVVPLGTEHRHLDLDTLICRLRRDP